MNEKEVGEIRRRFRPEKSNINAVCGCYVNENREIVSRFRQSLALSSEEETEHILGLLKKSLSGALGRNLLDIAFETHQVVDSDEHRLLMALRNSGLKDEAALEAFYEKTAQALRIEGTYLILLACDVYDVPFRSRDGELQEDASADVYSYILCSICPVKESKPALSYDVPENLFRSRELTWLVSPPEAGFLFPAFDDRCANLYNALYYTKNTADNHPELVEALFCQEAPMPADTQRETFQDLLTETLAQECSLDSVQQLREQFSRMAEEHKESKSPQPMTVSKRAVGEMLRSCGAPEERMAEFEEKFDERFGPQAELAPGNLVDIKRLEVRTPGVVIRVDPEHEDLVETRVIDGKRYILIRAEEGVEVNGMSVRMPFENGSAG